MFKIISVPFYKLPVLTMVGESEDEVVTLNGHEVFNEGLLVRPGAYSYSFSLHTEDNVRLFLKCKHSKDQPVKDLLSGTEYLIGFGNERAVYKFLLESNLRCPNVLYPFSIARDKLLFPFLSNKDLLHYIYHNYHKLSQHRQILKFSIVTGFRIANGLNLFHSNNFVHGDFKLNNFLIELGSQR